MYLQRLGDHGLTAYKSTILIHYKGDQVCRFEPRQPDSSRADIRAKGVWKDGQWTIEFGRALDTGNNDDIRLDPNRVYQFGLSRFEIAGREEEPETTQPKYGCGDVTESISLKFGTRLSEENKP